MEDVLSAISTVGFPIVAVLGCSWFIYIIWMKNTEFFKTEVKELTKLQQSQSENFQAQIESFNKSIESFNSTLASIDARLQSLELYLSRNNK